MFMPFFIYSGRIILTIYNARDVIKWVLRDIVEPSVLHKVEVIDGEQHYKYMRAEDYRLMELLFAKLPNVKKIVLGAIPDDIFLNYIHRTCHRLVHLHFEV